MHSYAYVRFSALSCVFVRIDPRDDFRESARQRPAFNGIKEREHQ